MAVDGRAGVACAEGLGEINTTSPPTAATYIVGNDRRRSRSRGSRGHAEGGTAGAT